MFFRRNRKVLVVVGQFGQLNYYREVAGRLSKAGCEVALCCDRDDAQGIDDAVRSAAESIGVPYFKHDGEREAGELDEVHAECAKRLMTRFQRDAKRRKVLSESAYRSLLKYHLYRLQDARRILETFRPGALVTADDGIAANMWMIKAAVEKWIRVVSVPYGIGDSAGLVWKGIAEKHACGEAITSDTPSGAYVLRKWPKWVKRTKYGSVMYFPPEFIAALEDLGIKLRDPWCFQGGQGNAVVAESRTMYEHYLSEGVPKRKIRRLGSVYTDVLHDGFADSPPARAAFDRASRIDNDRFRVLVCVPPSDHSGWGRQAEFGSVADYVAALSNVLKGLPGAEVTWSLHPRMFPEDLRAVLATGITPSSEFVVGQIPRHDVLIASNSSVARWAIAARKIVLNYDLYRFGVNDHPNVPTYVYTDRFSELRGSLEKFSSAPDAYRRVVQSALADATAMGEVDGRSATRIAEFLGAIGIADILGYAVGKAA
jgi:hypothetical protein